MENSEQVSTRVIAPKEVRVLPINSIVVGHRFRQEKGDINTLADSIKQNGLIHPIVVTESADGNGYYLLAGGRRIAACKILGWTNITCNIYEQGLTQLERNVIELCENIDRKDMEYEESVALTNQIHIAMQKLYGEKKGGIVEGGHSLRDTAAMLGKSPATVSQDIKLAEAMEIIPELRACKNKHDAMKLLEKIERQYGARVAVERVEKERGTTTEDKLKEKIINSYILGDFFERIREIPSGSIDLCEVDPPFAIDLKSIKKGGGLTTMDYNEWGQEDYTSMILVVMKECYRVLNDHGWLLWWFAYEPWFEPVYQAIINSGFKGNRIPAIWVKPTGQASNPDLYLASSHEPFFYARKGDASIKKMGRPNYYQYKPVSPDSKIHPTEKPIELMEEIYKTFVLADSRILIPFVGSGNGILAAYNVHCTAFGYDLGRVYKDAFTMRADSTIPPNYRSYGG